MDKDKVFFLFISWNVLMSNASVLHSPPPAFASADYFYPSFVQGVPKKVGLRILNRFDSYCLKDHLDGSKLGKNM